MNKEYWKKIYLLHSELSGYKKKVADSIIVITEFIKKNPACYVSWSGGKDSTAMLHLVISVKKSVKVMTEKDDMDFPGEDEYVEMMTKKYKLDIDIVRPEIKLWDIIGQYDITEDIHSRASDFSQKYFYSLIEKYKKENKRSGVFLGLRTEESKGRRYNRKKKGLIYIKKDGDIICQPISDWTAKDVFAYLFSKEVPIFDVYFKTKYVKSPEQIRKSWILPSFMSTQGQAVWLKYYYPDIFYKLAKINNKILQFG